MAVLKLQVNSSLNFALFFIAMTHNSSLIFKVIPFLLWTKGSHQCPNFDTFKWSGENLPNFSCHFSNHKSVFLQNLHNSLVPWKIIPLYFCSSYIIYFGHKEPIKTQFFFECFGQNFWSSSCQFKNDKSAPIQFMYHSSLSWHIAPLIHLSSYISYFGQKNPIKVPILTLSSALVKICQSPHVIFQTTSHFFFKFCINLPCYER